MNPRPFEPHSNALAKLRYSPGNNLSNVVCTPLNSPALTCRRITPCEARCCEDAYLCCPEREINLKTYSLGVNSAI